jgi:ubiquinone/menaquinone biosynthesis C-methylase UbiE
MKKTAQDVKAFFERVAADWDGMRLAYYDERVIEKMMEISGVGGATTVADVGTGTGFVAAGVASRAGRIVAVTTRERCSTWHAQTWMSWVSPTSNWSRVRQRPFPWRAAP